MVPTMMATPFTSVMVFFNTTPSCPPPPPAAAAAAVFPASLPAASPLLLGSPATPPVAGDSIFSMSWGSSSRSAEELEFLFFSPDMLGRRCDFPLFFLLPLLLPRLSLCRLSSLDGSRLFTPCEQFPGPRGCCDSAPRALCCNYYECVQWTCVNRHDGPPDIKSGPRCLLCVSSSRKLAAAVLSCAPQRPTAVQQLWSKIFFCVWPHGAIRI